MYFTDQPKDSRPLKTMPLTSTARSISPISISYCSRLRTRLPKISFRTKEILVIITRVTRIPYSSGLFTERYGTISMLEKRENSGDSIERYAYSAKSTTPTTQMVGTKRPMMPRAEPMRIAAGGLGANSFSDGGILLMQRKSKNTRSVIRYSCIT